jgi:hypothetical protein
VEKLVVKVSKVGGELPVVGHMHDPGFQQTTTPPLQHKPYTPQITSKHVLLSENCVTH